MWLLALREARFNLFIGIRHRGGVEQIHAHSLKCSTHGVGGVHTSTRSAGSDSTSIDLMEVLIRYVCRPTIDLGVHRKCSTRVDEVVLVAMHFTDYKLGRTWALQSQWMA